MTPGTTSHPTAEWDGEPDETSWPRLRAADRCDGENPMTGKPCTLGHHRGYHRDATGAEWLDR